MPHLVKLASEKAARAEQQTKLLRDDLLAKCAAAVDTMDDGIAGYALVVWDKSGAMRTAYDASHGPIGTALGPTLAADALNRHVAVMLAKTDEIDDTDAS